MTDREQRKRLLTGLIIHILGWVWVLRLSTDLSDIPLLWLGLQTLIALGCVIYGYFRMIMNA